MATISLLWKVNFCWKPWGAQGVGGPGLEQQAQTSSCGQPLSTQGK